MDLNRSENYKVYQGGGDISKWQPVKYSFIKDPVAAETMHRDGYLIQPFLEPDQVEALRDLYYKTHQIKHGNGSMFFTHFSLDMEYREKIRKRVTEILTPSFDKYFENYWEAASPFVIKSPGPQSKFFIHQDPSFVDEFKHSHLHVWIPLFDVHIEDGPVCIMKHSHWFSSPYRSVTIPNPFAGIHHVIRRYLEPLCPKAGEALFLHSNTLHNSLFNTSGKPRPVVLSNIFPEGVKITTPFKDENNDTRIEIYEMPDDYFHRFQHFYHGVRDRPDMGKFLGYRDYNFPTIGEEEFLNLCKANNLEPLDLVYDSDVVPTGMVSEPI